MSKILRNKDKHGSYELVFKDNILRVLAIGSIGESLSEHFHADVLTLVTNIDVQLWAYYGDLLLCDGATFEAEKKMLEAHTFAIDNGCCADAYRMQSPLLKDQIERIRRKIGINTDLGIQVFDHEKEALTFLHTQINKYAQDHSDTK